MKQAYVSLVLLSHAEKPTKEQIEKVDKLLAREVRRHEIILVTKSQIFETRFKHLKTSGPFTLITVQSNSTTNDAMIAGLGRSVGDFVLEWSLSLSRLEAETISSLLLPSDHGNELIEAVPLKYSLSTRFFYKLVNQLRSSNQEVRPSLARVYSRRALNWLLDANRYESNMMALAAELPFQKSVSALPIERPDGRSIRERILEGFNLLIKGSRFGTVVPLLLSGVSSLLAFGIAIYALAVFLLFGDAVEGWTSIAVLIGLGQGAILALIGMVWSRLDSLTKGLTKRNDVTVKIEVFPAALD
jgi:hypothetical protein